jgi:hypothetical protein
MGASLLVFLNKTDVEGCMTEDEVRRVSYFFSFIFFLLVFFFFFFFFFFLSTTSAPFVTREQF